MMERGVGSSLDSFRNLSVQTFFLNAVLGDMPAFSLGDCRWEEDLPGELCADAWPLANFAG